jgi:hypothetical protein
LDNGCLKGEAVSKVYHPALDAGSPEKRVLMFKIPSRNLGCPLTFEEVPLICIGNSLRAMSNAELFVFTVVNTGIHAATTIGTLTGADYFLARMLSQIR